jgi:hypothetical protein
MKVTSWELFPDELRAALITRYPALSWRVTRTRRAEADGVTVGTRRSGVETQFWVSAVALEPLTLDELLETIHAEAERQLAAQRSA